MSNRVFTPLQLKQYADYEKIRVSAKYNMLDPRAGQAAGLMRDELMFIVKNYADLQRAYKKENP